MDFLEKLAIPKGEPGYISKAFIARVLAENYNIEYSNTKLKKLTRDELIAEYKRVVRQTEVIKDSTCHKKKSLTERIKEKLISIFRI